MPSRTAQNVQVGKRKFELSNLKKVLYPDDNIIKAELVEYYLKLAPTILTHAKGRPLSLVRFPEGITGESFFQKNKPEWAPKWIESVELGDEKKDYPLATEEATLVWLANLACIELHQMHSRAPHFDKPDYIVFDFDPPDNFTFPQVAELAMEFREHIETFGYHAFVKTTGRKGLHVLTPIEPKWSFDQAFEAAKAIAQPFVDRRNATTTLHIKKEYRKGKVLVDIYRNRQSQTIVAAYSLRGLPGATVSTPLTWDELPHIKSSKELNIYTVPERVLQNGDIWQGLGAYAVDIHTDRKPVPKQKKAAARTYKTPEQLESYEKKRSFEKTPEPRPAEVAGEGRAFVVHRHHASRLHYDLRLEHDGALKSWAVPKGLPPRPGIKRMAVQVEEHPLKYVSFEGAIPKGEYGGGMMWIYAQGKYEITKEKKDGSFYFRLNSKEISGEFRTYPTKDNQWLLERLDNPQIDWLRDPVEPMLAQSRAEPMNSDDYVYEVKWDGIRALIAFDEGEMRIHSRNRLDLTAKFPELLIPEEAFRATNALFDAEIVCLDAQGKPVFKNVINRMQQNAEGAILRAKSKFPAVCYVFDCLYLDGRSIVNEPLLRRRDWLKDAIKKDTSYRVSEIVEDGRALFEAAKQLGLEGIMAKEKNSIYQAGKRSEKWFKIKTRHTVDCVIIGYTEGKGDRRDTFGALQIAQKIGDKLKYVGKVGTGFDDHTLKTISAELKKIKTTKRLIEQKPLDDAQTVWIEPKVMCEVQYASFTKDEMLREPVFLRLRPDLT